MQKFMGTKISEIIAENIPNMMKILGTEIQEVYGYKNIWNHSWKCSKYDENFRDRNSRSSINLSRRNIKKKFNKVHKNKIAENC